MILIEPNNFCVDQRFDGPLDGYECKLCGHFNDCEQVCEHCEERGKCEGCGGWGARCGCEELWRKMEEKRA